MATGIPPQYLLDDSHMLQAILAVLKDQAKEAERSRMKRGR